MRILVTGGAGFIGSHYVRTALGGGYPGFEDARITVLDKLSYAGNLANLDSVAGCPRLTVRRGANSVLSHGRHALAGIDPIGDWRSALHRAWPTLRAPAA
jgi:dTDP-glucose 4,6-dehydratase